MKAYLLGLFVLSALGWGCGDDPDPYEELDKLRAIGVTQDPLTPVPSTDEEDQTVTLTFHAFVPNGETISAEVFEDEDSFYATPVSDLAIVAGSETTQEYENLTYYTVQAQFVVPNEDLLNFSTDAESSVALLRYGLRLSAGSEEEKIVGTSFVVPPSLAALRDYQDLAIEITKPAEGETIGRDADIDIEAAITNENGEEFKIGWFVSHGRIENRRSKESKWETASPEKQLLVATIRGQSSRSFALQIREITTQ